MDARDVSLKRNKTIAGGLMVGAAVLFIIASTQDGGSWEWVAAFAEAAMVGALADWFAVVALFRHPLGVPIPHTAIIANKKDTIAENLAQFIQDKFLATEAVVAKLRELNPAGFLSSYLTSRRNADELANGLTRVISESLDFLDDERVRKVLRAAMNDRIEKFDLSTSAALLLDTLRRDSRHQVVLDEMLRRLGAWLSTPESQDKLAGAIDHWCDTEYPLLSRFIPNRPQFAKGAGEKIVNRVNLFLQAVNEDPSHELRHEFDRAVSDFTVKLKHDAATRAEIEGIKLEAINNAQLSEYANSILGDMKSWLIDDLDRPHSRIRKSISDAAVGLGNTLSKSKELSDSVNEHLEAVVRHYADDVRSGIARHISGTMKDWKSEDFVREIELSIGSDLQFIRMNGTLVGGVIGLLLHAVALLLR
ncbi:MAG: hypothetical protein A2075_22630 [Geobacteraceae bacterium GWC2_58_44]|nr:MAG: hypothetical protein A2075_22630 [Geobacteraceae bacterium GWC2_58_44]